MTWFLIGFFIAFDLILAYAWLKERRANRTSKLVQRVRAYTGGPW